MKFPCTNTEYVIKTNKGCKTALGASFSCWGCKCISSAPNYSSAVIPAVINKKFCELG